jgi:hypothetical protein
METIDSPGNERLGAARPDEPAEPTAPLPPNRESFQWLKAHSFWVSVIAIIVSGISAFNSCRSSNFAELSAKAALTNADWASYQRNPHHELVARVLKVGLYLRGWGPSDNTNGVAFIDVALINNGNQSEILRRATLYYADSTNENRTQETYQLLNTQIPKGDKQVLHLVLDHGAAFVSKPMYVSVGLTAIGAEAEDIESIWRAAMFNLPPDGNGGSYSPYPTNAIPIVTDQRLSTQRTVEWGGF